jgi:hypothetical protein
MQKKVYKKVDMFCKEYKVMFYKNKHASLKRKKMAADICI